MGGTLPIIIEILQAVAVLSLGVGAILLYIGFNRATRSLNRIEGAIGRIADEARPVFDRARAVGENVNYMVMSVRKEVERAGESFATAHDRLLDALDGVEDGVRDFGAVLNLARDEVEETVLTATSALRGLRTGAKMLGPRRRGNDSRGTRPDDEDEGEGEGEGEGEDD